MGRAQHLLEEDPHCVSQGRRSPGQYVPRGRSQNESSQENWMWPEDKGLLIPHRVVLRWQLVNKGLEINGPGLPARKAAQSNKRVGWPFGVVPLTSTWCIHWARSKAQVPLFSSPPLSNCIQLGRRGPSSGPVSANYPVARDGSRVLHEAISRLDPNKDTNQGLTHFR